MRTPNSPHAVLILAAGHSRRLGTPKQLLRVQGETLLARTVRLATGTRPSRVLVALPAGLPVLAAEVDPALAHVLLIDDDTRGKASTLACAARHLPDGGTRVLVVCADHPALEANHLAALLRAATASPSGAAATAYDDGAGEPAVVPVDLLRAFRANVHDQGLRAHLQSPDVHRVMAPERLARIRVDTPAQLLEARRAGEVDT